MDKKKPPQFESSTSVKIEEKLQKEFKKELRRDMEVGFKLGDPVEDEKDEQEKFKDKPKHPKNNKHVPEIEVGVYDLKGNEDASSKPSKPDAKKPKPALKTKRGLFSVAKDSAPGQARPAKSAYHGLGPFQVPVVLRLFRRPFFRCRCYRWLENLVRSLFQDTIILYFFTHYLLVYLAVGVCASGLQFTVMGAHQYIQVGELMTDVMQTWDVYYKIFGGVMILMSALLLLLGATTDRITLLYWFMAFSILNLIGILGGIAFTHYTNSEKQVDGALHDLLHNKDAHREDIAAMDKIQIEFSCCGADGEEDYSDEGSDARPESCCFKRTDAYHEEDKNKTKSECKDSGDGRLNTKGCTKPLTKFRQAHVAQHYVFFVFGFIMIFCALTLTTCYIPLARRKRQLFEEGRIEEVSADPFRRSLVAAAILAQIDDELVADEMLLTEEAKGALESFRHRVATCKSMIGIHAIIADSVDIIELIKIYDKNPDHYIRTRRKKSEKSLVRLSKIK